MKQSLFIMLFAATVIIMAGAVGCKKPGPIELSADEPPVQLLPADNVTSPMLATSDIDSSLYFPELEEHATAHLLLEAAEFDAVGSHHDAVLARSLFFDPTSRIVLPGDTLFTSVNAGNIDLDLLVLHRVNKRFRNEATGTDTLVGPQYVLYGLDGTGGGGLSYDDGRVYTWTATGSALVPRFTAPMAVPPRIHVTAPTPANIVRATSNLTVRWTGGADTVRIVIRNWENDRPGALQFQLRVVGAGGKTVIPRSVLGILPENQGKFLFTVISSQTAQVRPAGFSVPILVQAVTSHSLVIQVRP